MTTWVMKTGDMGEKMVQVPEMTVDLLSEQPRTMNLWAYEKVSY